jgi:hypothetical protein
MSFVPALCDIRFADDNWPARGLVTIRPNEPIMSDNYEKQRVLRKTLDVVVGMI